MGISVIHRKRHKMSEYITAEEVMAKVKQMTVLEQARLKDMLYTENEKKENLDEYLLPQRFSEGRVCPHCGGKHIQKHGHRGNGTQRYRCMECGKTFTLRTNSIFEGTRKSADVWRKFMQCMADHKSLDKCAEECGIQHNTAFVWRHKILDAISEAGDSALLSGVVESDETFFPVSYKGNSKHFEDDSKRLARRRGSEIHQRGLSDELVCVPCAVDAKGNSASRIAKLGKCSIKGLQLVLGNRIASGSTLCSDGDASYKGFAKSNELNLVQIVGGKRSKGSFNIQRINGYHSRLKKFIGYFNGVSTKYLNNYLTWNNVVEYSKVYLDNKISLLFEASAKALTTVRSLEVGNRPEIPVLV